MNKSHLKLTLGTGLACIALLTGSAGAITASAGDLILGFRAAGGQGSSLNLEVNLGPASSYGGLAPNTSFVVTRLNVLDLVSTYGANWDVRDDLSFGIVGATGASPSGGFPARTLWASSAETTPGSASSPWQRGSASAQQNASGAITTIYSGPAGSLANGSATANSAFSTVINAGDGGSWSVQEDLTVGNSFRRFTPTVRISLGDIPAAPSVYDGTNGYSVLDVWEVRPGSGDGALLGAFGLNAGGQLVFSNSPSVFAAVPEPTVSLSLTAASLALLARRRRTAR